MTTCTIFEEMNIHIQKKGCRVMSPFSRERPGRMGTSLIPCKCGEPKDFRATLDWQMESHGEPKKRCQKAGRPIKIFLDSPRYHLWIGLYGIVIGSSWDDSWTMEYLSKLVRSASPAIPASRSLASPQDFRNLLPGAAQKPCGVNFLEFWWKKKPTKTLDSSFFFHQNSKIPAFGGKFGGIKKKIHLEWKN